MYTTCVNKLKDSYDATENRPHAAKKDGLSMITFLLLYVLFYILFTFYLLNIDDEDTGYFSLYKILLFLFSILYLSYVTLYPPPLFFSLSFSAYLCIHVCALLMISYTYFYFFTFCRILRFTIMTLVRWVS